MDEMTMNMDISSKNKSMIPTKEGKFGGNDGKSSKGNFFLTYNLISLNCI